MPGQYHVNHAAVRLHDQQSIVRWRTHPARCAGTLTCRRLPSYRCPIREACLADIQNVSQTLRGEACKFGYRGPLCTLCIEGWNMNADGTCSICGGSSDEATRIQYIGGVATVTVVALCTIGAYLYGFRHTVSALCPCLAKDKEARLAAKAKKEQKKQLKEERRRQRRHDTAANRVMCWCLCPKDKRSKAFWRERRETYVTMAKYWVRPEKYVWLVPCCGSSCILTHQLDCGASPDSRCSWASCRLCRDSGNRTAYAGPRPPRTTCAPPMLSTSMCFAWEASTASCKAAFTPGLDSCS